MQRPELACDLVQVTCAPNWMRTSIPNYAEVAETPRGLLCRSRWADKEETAETFLNSEMGLCTSTVFRPTQTTSRRSDQVGIP
jgi:hypothetical protein